MRSSSMSSLSSHRRNGSQGTQDKNVNTSSNNFLIQCLRCIFIDKKSGQLLLGIVIGVVLWSEVDQNRRLMTLMTTTTDSYYSMEVATSTYKTAISTVLYSNKKKCQPPSDQLNYIGPISLVWAWHDPPPHDAFSKTLDSLLFNDNSQNTVVLPSSPMIIDIYCGSSTCMDLAQKAATDASSSVVSSVCINVHFLVVPILALDTPLEEWAGDHLLAKLLYGNHFEETLQVAMQLVVLWKGGGMVLLPGSTLMEKISTQELWQQMTNHNNNRVLLHTGNEDESSSPVLLNTGLYAAAAPTIQHPAIAQMMESMLTLSSWPTYDPNRWPVQVEWSKLVSSSSVSNIDDKEAVITTQIIDTRTLQSNEANKKKRHFGTLTYQARRAYLKSKGNPGMNRGDEMQGLGGLQFLPRLDAFVERDRLDVVSVIGSSNFTSSSEPVTPETPPRPAAVPTTAFLNAWYGTPDMVWPPPGNLEPIFVAMHLNNQKVKDKFNSSKSTEYLSDQWPIGARDTSTEAFFQSAGVHALFSACMTMTLRPSVSPERQRLSQTDDDILIVDVTQNALDILPEHVNMAARTLTAKVLDKVMVDDQLGRYILAHDMKTSLQKAKLVITQRLHVALPAASMGTPVILILDDKLPGGGGVNGNSRFSGLQAAVHTVNIHSVKDTADAVRMLHTFDWDSPPPNPSPETIAIRRNALQVLTMCHGTDLFDSGRKFGIVPSTWKYPFEQTVCNDPTDQKGEEEEVIHIASAFNPDWVDSFPVFSSWINALYKSNGKKKFAFYFLTSNMTPKGRCLVRWITSLYFPESQVYTIATDEMLTDLPYKGLRHIPVVTQARLFLDGLLPCVDDLLWLDGDVFVMGDLEPLWRQRFNLPDCGIAGRNSAPGVVDGMMRGASLSLSNGETWTQTSGGKNGFNAGVMLMSLDRLRQTKFMEDVASFWAFENGANDQVTLNMQCNGTHSVLDPIWNVYQDRPEDLVYERPEDWRIVHMQSSKKPWIEAKTSGRHGEIWNGIHLSLIDALLGPQTEEDRIAASI